MKKTEQLLRGEFEYEQPALLFSEDEIRVKVRAGEKKKGELYLKAANEQMIQGYVTSTNRRIMPGLERFSGINITLPYGIDGVGMQPGESFEACLYFVTSVGEYKLLFTVEAESGMLDSSLGNMTTLDDFCKVAKNDFNEAYRIFTGKKYESALRLSNAKDKALYRGMSNQPVTFQNLEEYLIGLGKKEKVLVSLEKDRSEFYKLTESIQESVTIQRSGWGHLRLEVEVYGDFLKVSKKVILADDFIGSNYKLDFIINKKKLNSGMHHGKIVFISPYQRMEYHIYASRMEKLEMEHTIEEKRQKLNLLRDYRDYRCQKKTREVWLKDSQEILDMLAAKGIDFLEYQLYQAYLYCLQDKKELASDILKKCHNKSALKSNPEYTGIYLWLGNLCGIYQDIYKVRNRINSLFMQNDNSLILFLVLLYSDAYRQSTASRIIFMMEELFEKGCRSPFLYLEAWNQVCKDESLLHRLTPFWVQVFLFAGRNHLLTEEMTMRLSYLSGYQKIYQESLYKALVLGYDAFPSRDMLEAICKYIMMGNPRRKDYFKWYESAIMKRLRLTRLYEYYVETMDTTYRLALPKALLLYFAYNANTLGNTKKAYIYSCIVANKEEDPDNYQTYQNNMHLFARKMVREGRINENYAVLYQEFMQEFDNGEDARCMSEKMFTSRIYCDDKKIKKVIVRHSQMKLEETYPCIKGVAYPRIYTEDAVVIFQDDKQRRYYSTISYTKQKLLDEKKMVLEVLKYGIFNPGVLLNYCEEHQINEENISIYIKASQEKSFTDEYRNYIRKQILDHYMHQYYEEDKLLQLEKFEYIEYAAVDKTAVLTLLIELQMFREAMAVVEEFGIEGMDIAHLLRLASRMIEILEYQEDEELIQLALFVYHHKKHDENILEYLMKYVYGPVDELFSIWESAKAFDLDTYALEGRILNMLLLTSDYRKKGEEVLKSYIRNTGREQLISAYITQAAYGIFVKEYDHSSFMKEQLMHIWREKWTVDKVCYLALLKILSSEKTSDSEIMDQLLEECVKMNMFFSFFKDIPQNLLEAYQLDDKTYVEYHTSPEARVTLYYALDTGLKKGLDYTSEPLRNIYEGIFSKTFTLFYGETLYYYFKVENGDKIFETEPKTISMNITENTHLSKYQLINQILSARKFGEQEDLINKIKIYLYQEQYAENMFEILKES